MKSRAAVRFLALVLWLEHHKRLFVHIISKFDNHFNVIWFFHRSKKAEH